MYIGLVKQHQAAEKKRKKMERRAMKEQRVPYTLYTVLL